MIWVKYDRGQSSHKIGNLAIFGQRRSGFGLEPRDYDYPLFIQIDNRPTFGEATIPVLLLMLSAIALLFNILVLGNGFSIRPGGYVSSGVVANAFLSFICFSLFWALMPYLALINFLDLALINVERWVILSGQEIVFLERGHKRIFVNFAPYLSFKSFGRDSLKRLAFHYIYDTSTIGRGCMNPRVRPDVLIWTLSIYDDSQPERTDPRYDLDFNTAPVYLGDLAYESAQELRRNLSVWLPENTELRPLPPLENARGKRPTTGGAQ